MENPKSKPKERRPFFKRRIWKVFGVIFLILLVVRLVLPHFVLKYVNKKLAEMKDYYGHASDIDISLFRGAYVIKDLTIVRLDSIERKAGKRDTIPFFTSPKIDLSIQWAALFKGSLVGEIVVEKPVVNFVKGNHRAEDLDADTSDFRQLIKDLMPLKINHFEITDGEIHYIDPGFKPAIDIAMANVHIMAVNLKNVDDSTKVLPAHLDATGDAYGGHFTMDMDFDGLNKIPTFDMNAELKDLNLVDMNSFFQAYGNFDVEQGTFGLYMEFAAKEKKFGGYVKPLLKDVKVAKWNKQEGGIAQILWETVIGTGIEVFENQNRDQFATKVAINGSFDDPKIRWLPAIGFILRNAFVHALRPSIDNSIDINSLQDVPKPGLIEKMLMKKENGSTDKKGKN